MIIHKEHLHKVNKTNAQKKRGDFIDKYDRQRVNTCL